MNTFYKIHLFLWSKLNFQHHYSSLQCHMIFRNHSNMIQTFWTIVHIFGDLQASIYIDFNILTCFWDASCMSIYISLNHILFKKSWSWNSGRYFCFMYRSKVRVLPLVRRCSFRSCQGEQLLTSDLWWRIAWDLSPPSDAPAVPVRTGRGNVILTRPN